MLVKGKVDHKDKSRIVVVVSSVERFEPTSQEVAAAEEQAAKAPATALRLRLDAAALPATVIGDLRDVLANFPGDADVVIELSTRAGARRLRLGEGFRVERSAGLHAELNDLLGSAILPIDARATAPA